ncbi:MAG TPA: hypothetical protein VGR37_10755 [Longimicrobiaceae bacterium]|nr:hypothetical protein [Longimicrobiaceae bacterium]
MASENQEQGRKLTIPGLGELSVEELEEIAGGAETNIYCPTTNKEGCNSECKPATAPTVT